MKGKRDLLVVCGGGLDRPPPPSFSWLAIALGREETSGYSPGIDMGREVCMFVYFWAIQQTREKKDEMRASAKDGEKVPR